MGGELDGAIKAGSTPQVTFVLPDAKAADTFEQQVTDSAIAIAAGPIGSRLLGKQRPHRRPARSSRSPTRSRSGGNASIGVDSPGGYANGSIDLGQALGIRKNLTEGKPNSGDITAYYRVDGKLAGEGGLLVGEGAGGALAGDQTLAVTFELRGKPKALTLTATRQLRGQAPARRPVQGPRRRRSARSTASTSRPARARARRSRSSSTCRWTTRRGRRTLRSRSCGVSTRSPAAPRTPSRPRPSPQGRHLAERQGPGPHLRHRLHHAAAPRSTSASAAAA